MTSSKRIIYFLLKQGLTQFFVTTLRCSLNFSLRSRSYQTFFIRFFFFGFKLGHFTINYFFPDVINMQAYQQKTEKFFVSEEKEFYRFGHRCQFHQLYYIKIFQTNVILAAFFQLHVRYVYLEKAAGMMFVRKMHMYKVDEIDGRLHLWNNEVAKLIAMQITNQKC